MVEGGEADAWGAEQHRREQRGGPGVSVGGTKGGGVGTNEESSHAKLCRVTTFGVAGATPMPCCFADVCCVQVSNLSLHLCADPFVGEPLRVSVHVRHKRVSSS